MVTEELLAIRVGDIVIHSATPKIEGEVLEVKGASSVVRWAKPRMISALGIQLNETVKVSDLSLTDPNEAFWRSAPEDTVLHYHHGHGEWMRGVVEAGMFRPQALVGTWGPQVTIDYTGQMRESSGLRRISSGQSFRPHFANIYESGVNPRFVDTDPTAMPAIDLSAPELTEKQKDIIEQVSNAQNDLDALKQHIDELRTKFYEEAK